ncbi:inactive tyrosine-protein kinase 7-like [Daktulosphaira vitifoliae]|uniref:inactive tyrosine-protein kinase 7-like n=1 Tax=Daktulosphaira vitifoliae TaxID=58002 RepID=UPI0021AA33D2|nr:inactive tyrosine-protein kinase 7-like [Daktulosphaira vitifoliae]
MLCTTTWGSVRNIGVICLWMTMMTICQGKLTVFTQKPSRRLTTQEPSSLTERLQVTTVNSTDLLYPFFDYYVPRNITTTIGQSAFLHCRTENLNDKSVSWMRKRDLHILTAGVLTYTSDQRFQVIHPDNSDNWTLLIKFAQPRDAGIYECQVNTEPKMSLAFQLNVVEMRARICGPQELYVNEESEVTMRCELSQGPHDLGTIFWYLGNTPVYTDQVSLQSIRQPRVSVHTEWADGLKSTLHIARAKLSDSGNYTCVPTFGQSATINVHVVNGEHPAAMQHGNRSAVSGQMTVHVLVLLSLLIMLSNPGLFGH